MALHRLHRFFYSTSFTLLFLFLFILLLITPADAIAQAYLRNDRIYNVLVIAGSYVLTALLALAIYISRIYSVRQLMEEIPKSWAPVKKMDLPKRMHKAISGNFSRSAIIAVQSRPNSTTASGDGGVISHPGWSAPSSVDLPEVHYLSVIVELPHLIEEKALSLQSGGQELSRQPYMTLRAYLAHLTALGVVGRGAADPFLVGYERARFRTRGEGVGEAEFRELIKVFGGLLRGMGEHAQLPIHAQDGEEGMWGTHDGEGGGGVLDLEDGVYSEGEGSVLRREGFGYMSIGYETTTTDFDDEEEDMRRYSPGPYTHGDPYTEHDTTVGSSDRYFERERKMIQRNLGGTRMQHSLTTTTVDTAFTSGEGFEMASLRPESTRTGGNGLVVRASTGTFG